MEYSEKVLDYFWSHESIIKNNWFKSILGFLEMLNMMKIDMTFYFNEDLSFTLTNFLTL